MNLRRWIGILVLTGIAVAISCGLFGLSWLLSSRWSQPGDFPDPVQVHLLTLPPPETPEPEPLTEPEPPRQLPRLDFTPELVPPRWDAPLDIDLDVILDLGDFPSAIPSGEFVFDSADLDQPPEAILRIPPIYPFKARQREIEGAVQVKLLIQADGTVGRVLLLTAEPPGLFEEAVQRAVPQWKFEPGRIDGRPVAAWVVTWIRFDLD